MAGQSDVDQAGDHYSHPEHPPGGQEREGEEVPHDIWGHETSGSYQTGGDTKHLSAGGHWNDNNYDCERNRTGFVVWLVSKAQKSDF